jgi:hypothetical protein
MADAAMRTQQSIHYSNVAKAVKIIKRSTNGSYEVETLDGLRILNCKNQTQIKWAADQWGSLEFIGGDWMLTGLSAQKGGE